MRAMPSHTRIADAAIDFENLHGQLPTAADGSNGAPLSMDWGDLIGLLAERSNTTLEKIVEQRKAELNTPPAPKVIPGVKPILRAMRAFNETRHRYPTKKDGALDAPEGFEWKELLAHVRAETGKHATTLLQNGFLYNGLGQDTKPEKTPVRPRRTRAKIDLTRAQVEAAIRLHTQAEGRAPASNNDDVKHGELAGKISWASINNALDAGRVQGLGKITLSALKAKMGLVRETTGDRKAKHDPISARDIFNDVARHIDQTGELPTAELTTALSRGRKGRQIAIAFQRGIVTDIETVVKKDAPTPVVSLQDFLVAAGFAETDAHYNLKLAENQPSLEAAA